MPICQRVVSRYTFFTETLGCLSKSELSLLLLQVNRLDACRVPDILGLHNQPPPDFFQVFSPTFRKITFKSHNDHFSPDFKINDLLMSSFVSVLGAIHKLRWLNF